LLVGETSQPTVTPRRDTGLMDRTTREQALSHRPPARRAVTLIPRARRIRHEVVVWAVQSGRSVCFDSLSLILAAKELHSGDVTDWTEDDVWHLWWVDLLDWCEVFRVQVPSDLANAFRTLFAFLDEVDGFSPGSDSFDDLMGALQATGATDPSGRRSVDRRPIR